MSDSDYCLLPGWAPGEAVPTWRDFAGVEEVFVASPGGWTPGRYALDYLKKVYKRNTGRTLRESQEWCLGFLARNGMGTPSGTGLEGVEVTTSPLAPHDPEFVAFFVREKVERGEADSMTFRKRDLAKEFGRYWKASKKEACWMTEDEILDAVNEYLQNHPKGR